MVCISPTPSSAISPMADPSSVKQNSSIPSPNHSSNQQQDQTDDHHASSSPESLIMVQPIPNTSTQQPMAMLQVPNQPQYGFTVPNILVGMPSLNQYPNNVNNQQPYQQYFILLAAQPNPSHYINVDPQPIYPSTTPTIIHVSSNPMNIIDNQPNPSTPPPPSQYQNQLQETPEPPEASAAQPIYPSTTPTIIHVSSNPMNIIDNQPNPSTPPPPSQYQNQLQETPEPPEASAAQPNPSKPTPPQSTDHPKNINQTPPPPPVIPVISMMAQPFSQPINSSTQPPNYAFGFYQAPNLAQINPPTTTPMILIPSFGEQNISPPPPPIAGKPPQTPNDNPDHQKDQISSQLPDKKRTAAAGGGYPGLLANKAGNLANLLPTGTVLAFQALVPSLSNNGKCKIVNKYLVGFVISFCAITCFLSSFTDSFKVGDKVYYGFATPKGLCIFNYENREEEEKEEKVKDEKRRCRMEFLDFVHAFGSLIVFLVFAISSAGVQDCYFPKADDTIHSVFRYLPLVAGVLSSFFFSIFPTKRKGIGIADDHVRH